MEAAIFIAETFENTDWPNKGVGMESVPFDDTFPLVFDEAYLGSSRFRLR